jgi:uncharacterized protein
MSEQQNLQTVKDAYAAFGRRDIPTVLKALTDDVEWTIPGEGVLPLGGVYHGRDGAARFFQKLAETAELTSFEPRDFVAQGDRVVALGQSKGRVKSTSRTFELQWAMAFTIRDGKVSKFREYTDTAALAAAFSGSAASA